MYWSFSQVNIYLRNNLLLVLNYHVASIENIRIWLTALPSLYFFFYYSNILNMTTIVSAFITNVNSRKDRTIEKYLEYGKVLLQTKIQKIIFIDEIIFNEFKNYSNEYTYLIPIKKEYIYLYKYKELITNFNLNSSSPEKDSLEYIFTMCSKTEWIKKAIEQNYFNSTNFIWIDFGIKHIFNCGDNKFIKKIEDITNKSYKKLRIGSIWNLNTEYYGNIFNDIKWYFAGGVFGGDIKSLLIFSEKTKEICIKIIQEKNTIMWEVNIWYLVYNEMPDLFDCYSCDHNSSLIDNY